MNKRFTSVLLTMILMLSMIPVTGLAGEAAEGIDAGLLAMMESGTFRPADVGMQAEDEYVLPYMGLKLALPEGLLERITAGEVYMTRDEGPRSDAGELMHSRVFWCAMTSEQRNAELNMMTDDMGEWLQSLEMLGAIGAYHKDVLDQIDEISGCTRHEKLGENADGRYHYYLSLGDNVDEETIGMLREIAVTYTDIEPYPDFCTMDGLLGEEIGEDALLQMSNVGNFVTEDIEGNAVDQSIFAQNKLTLVNVMATWCSPCVQEIPALEQLRQAMAERGVGIVGFVMDTVDEKGERDQEAIDTAKLLAERTGAQFPMLLPETTQLNGTLSGVKGFPTTYFVDGYGNVIGEAQLGDKTFEEWQTVVEEILAQMPEIIE